MTRSPVARGPGRPRVAPAEQRNWQVAVRLTEAEREVWSQAAERDRRSLSDWIRLQVERAMAHGGQDG